ncbi:MAG: M50 family metallopeptidase [Candidatus Hydrogenedentes bacterium]|jgi:hypothetical protein|nr:M50 family metallopeptidase [Candidatus Hydrogenedentota bacterium]
MKIRSDTDWREVAILLGLGAAVFFLWDTVLIYPLRLLVVFFHEMSHGLAAFATGGRVVEIQVVAAEGGLCITHGGNRFLTLSAGYLGSIMWGGIILVLASRARVHRGLSVVLGIIMLAVTLWLVQPIGSFGFGFGLLAGFVLIAAGFRFNAAGNKYLLKAIGLVSCAYAILDIRSDILVRPTACSDAYLLAQHTHVPALVWGLAWIATALVFGCYFLVLSSKRKPLAL